MKKLSYFFCYYFFLISLTFYAQKPRKDFEFFNVKKNISNIGICTITQDQYGFIWIGTNGSGLSKFDGIDYTTYKHHLKDSTSLSSSLIFCSYIDKNNNLWFGTEEGLNLYDREKDCFKRIPIKELTTKKSNVSIRSFQGDNNGNLFIGTYSQGLFILNLNTLNVTKVDSQDFNPDNPLEIHSLKSDKNGTIYAGTNRGLKEYDEKTNSLKLSLIRTVEGVKIIKDPIQSLYYDNNENLWVGTVSNGIYKISELKNTNDGVYEVSQYKISENRILHMINLPDGSLMCGTENDGLFHIDSKGNIVKHYSADKENEKSILANSVWYLFLDRNERIWIGYYNAGISIYDKLHDKFDNIESLHKNTNSLQIGSVTAIAKDDLDNFWISMDGGGIDVVDPTLSFFRNISTKNNNFISGLTDDYVESLFFDKNQNLWAGTWNKGLYYLKKGTTKFINYNIANTSGGLQSNNFLSIDEDSKGNIWFATWDKGLHSYNIKTKQFTHHDSEEFAKHGIPNCYARKVLIDKEDNLWLGTVTNGLFKIIQSADGKFNIQSLADRMAGKFSNYTTANHVLSIYQSKDGAIWIGTRGAGLCKYNPKDDTFSWYNKLNGVESDNITSIIEDSINNIWISSNSGISKLDFSTGIFKQYTEKDGLLSNDYNINATFIDNKKNLYFGNYLGIDFFNPSNIITNNIVPALYLTDFKLFNKTVTPNKDNSPIQAVIGETKNLTLDHTQSVFTIEYTGVNFTRPEKNNYAYYLEGYEESWNYVGQKRSATYTNLDHGEYTFKLKASNNDGIWNETPLELKIKILPPWWKTNWAIFIYGILFLTSIYLLNYLTQNRIKEKQLIKNERLQRQQKDELNKKKIQFFTNISHEFRTPLTLIMNPLKDIINNKELNLPQNIKNKHAIINKNTDRLYRLINELMDFRKLELNKMNVRAIKINLIDFTKNIVSYFKEEANNKNILLTVDTDNPDLMVWADNKMLEKIIFNLLSNAIKITPEGGAINIDLLSTEFLYNLPLVNKDEPVKAVEIIISDTGPGLEKDEISKIFERFYQAEKQSKTYFGGTGIGLEVVQSFVKLHKGEIEVLSEVGLGTSFKILLPTGNNHFNDDQIILDESTEFLKNDDFSFAPSVNIVQQEDEDLEMTKQHTVLIVEDNVELREYLKLELTNQYKVLIASNGSDGLKIAKETFPDVIITDVVMPEIDGMEFCKQIKSNISTSHIPVLMLTAKAKVEDRIEGIETGADAYMVKPFNIRLLKLRLAQLITSRQLIFNKYFSVISELPEDVNSTPLDKEFIENVLNHINENIGDPNLNVETLASQLNLSRSQFYRKIKALTNQTASEFLRNIRLKKAKQILEMGETNISKVCYSIGFSSHSYFTKCFKNYFGILPTEVKPFEEK
ncbi:response regulator [Seonamhaeicola sp. MEBiC1930]|uniref:hybrid sensor histidine kinase/response regulator transcription factor n=1 Tax=Seonamhaeicola sp. MEBiC01930 TaxID=2976768 RepID=UPI00324A2556